MNNLIGIHFKQAEKSGDGSVSVEMCTCFDMRNLSTHTELAFRISCIEAETNIEIQPKHGFLWPGEKIQVLVINFTFYLTNRYVISVDFSGKGEHKSEQAHFGS